jgi:hypothetical protein
MNTTNWKDNLGTEKKELEKTTSIVEPRIKTLKEQLKGIDPKTKIWVEVTNNAPVKMETEFVSAGVHTAIFRCGVPTKMTVGMVRVLINPDICFYIKAEKSKDENKPFTVTKRVPRYTVRIVDAPVKE